MMLRHTSTTLALLALLSACAPTATLTPATFIEAADLRTEGEETRHREGVTYLRRSYEVQVDVATDPSRATSHLRAHLVRVAWSVEDTSVVTIATPANARLTGVNARRISAAGEHPIVPTSQGSVAGQGTPDPDQAMWSLAFEGLSAGEALEVIADFALPGTLQWSHTLPRPLP